MPNHVVNEVIISCSVEKQAEIIGYCVNESEKVDFSILLPIPINYWMWSVGREEKEAFPGNALNWCTREWGTKWNAYGKHEVLTSDEAIILRFRTAWSAPRGWLCALFNKVNVSIQYGYLSEGGYSPRHGKFDMTEHAIFKSPFWSEHDAHEDLHRHLHILLHGDAEDFEVSK